MKKLLFVGHAFHNKTLSSKFFTDILEENYLVDYFWTLPFCQEVDIKRADLINLQYDVIIFWQIFPYVETLDTFLCKQIILIPMYDNDIGISYGKWRKYCKYKFINFSKNIHNKLLFLGAENNLSVQYAPEMAVQPITSNSTEKKAKIFFWQRGRTIDWYLIKSLLNAEQIKQVHMHRIEKDEQKDAWFIKPSQEDIEKYNITFSSWFESQDELLQKINECDVFVVPRLYEGIGQTFLEAMAMGKCVVSPDFPTMNEYIQNDFNGILFDWYNPQKLDLSNYKAIGANAQKTMQQISMRWKDQKDEILNFIDMERKTGNEKYIFQKNMKNISDIYDRLSFLKDDLNHFDDRRPPNFSHQFSLYLNILHNSLKDLQENHKDLIIYGAGTGAELILSIIPDSIDYIVDIDIKKIGTKLFGKTIYGIDKLQEENDALILLSVFGRAESIEGFLVDEGICLNRIISLDFWLGELIV